MKKISLMILLMTPLIAFCQQVMPFLNKSQVKLTSTPARAALAPAPGTAYLAPGSIVPAGDAVALVRGSNVLVAGSIAPQFGAVTAPPSTVIAPGMAVPPAGANELVSGTELLKAGTTVGPFGAVMLTSQGEEAGIQQETKRQHVSFFATTALSGEASSGIENSFSASGKLLALVNPIANFNLGIGANLLNVNPSKVKKDSVEFNSLMFPETGNFGVLITPSYRFKLYDNEDQGTISLIPFYEFAYRKVSVDSPQLSFKVYNHTAGCGLQWHYKPDEANEKNELTVTVSPYWHLFNIPVEDVKNFTTFVNDTLFAKAALDQKKIRVSSFGIKLTAQYSNFIFFADFRKNRHSEDLPDGDPFKGGAVNIGFLTSFRIGSF
jgi:hypothetical protein